MHPSELPAATATATAADRRLTCSPLGPAAAVCGESMHEVSSEAARLDALLLEMLGMLEPVGHAASAEAAVAAPLAVAAPVMAVADPAVGHAASAEAAVVAQVAEVAPAVAVADPVVTASASVAVAVPVVAVARHALPAEGVHDEVDLDGGHLLEHGTGLGSDEAAPLAVAAGSDCSAATAADPGQQVTTPPSLAAQVGSVDGGGSAADGTPADAPPSDGMLAEADSKPTEADGTPAGGTPADGMPAEAGGTPADGMPAEAGGTPAEAGDAAAAACGVEVLPGGRIGSLAPSLSPQQQLVLSIRAGYGMDVAMTGGGV